jgi:uncharacterized protein
MRALKTVLIGVVLASLGCHRQDVGSFLTIQKNDGERLGVRVEIADTPELRAHGLMFRKELPEGTGMLFLFPRETRDAFWMKNTPIPLDMIFIKQGAVVSIIENAVPYDESILQPDSSYTMTLEVPGGYASRHGVRLGDRVEWRR